MRVLSDEQVQTQCPLGENQGIWGTNILDFQVIGLLSFEKKSVYIGKKKDADEYVHSLAPFPLATCTAKSEAQP